MTLLFFFLVNPFFILTALTCMLLYLLRKQKPLIKLLFFNAAAIFLLLAAFDATAAAIFIAPSSHLRINNSYFHHGLRPNMDIDTFWGAVKYHIKTNSLGFMDREVRRVSPEKSGKRILLFGDSFVEGVGFPWEQTMAGIVSDTFLKEGIEVLNAGVVSYSPKLYYLKLKYLLEQEELKFDELWVFIDIGDMQDEIVYEYFVPEQVQESLLARKLHLFYYQRSFLYRSLADRAYYRQINPKNEHSQYWGDLAGYYAARGNWTFESHHYERWVKQGINYALSYMDKLYQITREKGIKLHISVQPWPQQLEHNETASPPIQIWSKFCADRSIDFINLYPLFMQEPPKEAIRKYYIEKDIHWNAQGHKLVADEVIKHLKQSKQ